jgi:hypothetical protein
MRAQLDREIPNLPLGSQPIPRLRNYLRPEVLWGSVLVLIGAIIFLSLPKNVVTVRPGIEENLGITRAEAVNMATVAFIQSRGRERAEAEWIAAAGVQERYELLSPYLAFAPKNFEDFMPAGYSVVLPKDLRTLSKVPLLQGLVIRY